MAIRKIIKIDEAKCTGCGLCIPNCKEGAIKIIDNKARLISDLFCDGLGACLGHCPEDAIKIEEREAEPYDERKVMEIIVTQGENTIKEHLLHLLDHGEDDLYRQAIDYLDEHDLNIPNLTIPEKNHHHAHGQGCPGSRMMDFSQEKPAGDEKGQRASQLKQWPVQLHLVPPTAPYFRKADLLLAADCTAYAAGDFHKDYLKGKALAIACPKLDEGKDIYLEKLTMMIDQGGINSMTIMTMEVPCCTGLVHLAKQAKSQAQRNVPIKHIKLSIQGEVLEENWLD
ncbi:MAG: 4Fe-4S binding protein [Spirochaetales bacterium]|nr:4Fe-4S binding protein [Spirochaetales bacterium]